MSKSKARDARAEAVLRAVSDTFDVKLTGKEIDCLLTGLGTYRDAATSDLTNSRIEQLQIKLTTAVQETLGGPDCWCGTVGRPEGAEPHLKGSGKYCGDRR